MHEVLLVWEEPSLSHFAMLHVLLRYDRMQILHFHVQYTPKGFADRIQLRAKMTFGIASIRFDVRDTNL